MLAKPEILKRLVAYGLGLERGTVRLVEHQHGWKDAFAFLSDLVQKQLYDKNIVIEHIGSTAIPGALAKPIIDVMIVSAQDHDFAAETISLEQSGFLAKGDYGIAGRHYFNFYNTDDTIEYIHIHAFPRGHAHIDHVLTFRNKLLADPFLVQQYSALKARLVEGSIPRKDYTAAKTGFVESVLKKQ